MLYEVITDLHKSHVDPIVLVSPTGRKMYRESDLIDVWFDSGAMPYAQRHYPFEWKEKFSSVFPADFIAEGVDQTRGWFFTLHAIRITSYNVCYTKLLRNYQLWRKSRELVDTRQRRKLRRHCIGL